MNKIYNKNMWHIIKSKQLRYLFFVALGVSLLTLIVSAITFDSDLMPGADDSYSIGAVGQRFKNLYVSQDVVVSSKLGVGTTTLNNALQVGGSVSIGYLQAAPINSLIISGSLGLGTSSPAYKLEVVGDAVIHQGQLRLGNYSSNPTAIGLGSMYYNTTDNKLYYYNGTEWSKISGGGVPGIQWTTSGNDIYNANTGNVGIGLSTPVQKLTLFGNLAVVSTSNESGFAVTSNPSSYSDVTSSIAVDSLYIYSVGWDKIAENNDEWRMEKRDKTTGALVTSFDGDGVVTSNPSTGVDQANAILVDASYLYIAGYDDILGNKEWRIEKRDKTTGALVTSFDGDGVVTSNPGNKTDIATSITSDSSYIYVVGYDESPNDYQWRIEKRDKTTGALVTSFDGDGVITSNPDSGPDYAYSVALDASYIYIVGDTFAQNNYRWRIEKRDKITGALVVSFDGDGIVTSNPSSGDDYARATVVDSLYIYVVGSDYSPGNAQWRIEKRDKTTGVLVTSFDGDGIIINNPSSNDDYVQATTIDSLYIYVIGQDKSLGNYQWRIEKRDKTTGALVTSFDGDGVVTNNPSSGDDYGQAMAIDSSYIYAAGSDESLGNDQWRIERRTIGAGSSGSGINYESVFMVDNNEKKAAIKNYNFFIPQNDADFVVNGSMRVGDGGTVMNKIQFGEIGGLSAGQAGSSGAVYFPAKFSKAPIIHLTVDESIDGNGATYCRVSAKTDVSFSYACDVAADGVFWMAIEP